MCGILKHFLPHVQALYTVVLVFHINCMGGGGLVYVFFFFFTHTVVPLLMFSSFPLVPASINKWDRICLSLSLPGYLLGTHRPEDAWWFPAFICPCHLRHCWAFHFHGHQMRRSDWGKRRMLVHCNWKYVRHSPFRTPAPPAAPFSGPTPCFLDRRWSISIWPSARHVQAPPIGEGEFLFYFLLWFCLFFCYCCSSPVF